jgi:hypothetical protein
MVVIQVIQQMLLDLAEVVLVPSLVELEVTVGLELFTY